MQIKELNYFFESYNIPMLRYLYPTNEQLWAAFNKQETAKTKLDTLSEIDWVINQPNSNQQDIMRFLNQVGTMGPIRFKKTQEMIDFLIQMKAHITI
jgi:hypothetical protein